MESSNSIFIRSFNGNGMGHEIRLPNGKTILIDPYLTGVSGVEGVKETAKADYILLTHTHFDHDLDVGYFVRKYNPIVIAGIHSAPALMKFHHIPYTNLLGIDSNEKYHFADFSLETWRAKHNNSGGRIWSAQENICKEATGIDGHVDCDTWGYLESMDYLITLNNNFRIMIASGELVWDTAFEKAKQLCPDLLIRQAGRRNGDMETGQQIPAQELAVLFMKYHAQIVIPGHFDVLRKRWGEEKTDSYFAEVKKYMSQKNGYLLYPKRSRWYEIGIFIDERQE